MSKKNILITFLALLLSINLVLVITNKTFVYKALIYNYVDIDDYKIFENREIYKSSTPIIWEHHENYNKTEISKELKYELEELETIALTIIKDGKIIHEEYWNGYSDSSLSNSFSMAKSVVSLLVGIAIDEGKIKSIDEPIGNYLPHFAKGESKKITIKHLLTMSSGLNWDESYGSPISKTTEGYYGTDLTLLINELEVINEPGSKWRYKSGDTQLLSFVLSKAVSMNLSEYFQLKLWEPLGALQNALWSLDNKNGVEKAYCCINSNALDFAKIGQLVLQNGIWNNKRLISEEYLNLLKTPCKLPNENNEKVNYYGLQWWLIKDYKENDITYARGILGQYIIIIPKKNVVVVRLGKNRGEKINNHRKEVYSLIDEILQNY